MCAGFSWYGNYCPAAMPTLLELYHPGGYRWSGSSAKRLHSMRGRNVRRDGPLQVSLFGGALMAVRIDHATTSGTFSLDGQTHQVDNNAWVIGDDSECAVIDAPHDVNTLKDLIGGRKVHAVLATHAHDDHVRKAPELADAVGAPIFLHPEDLPLWRMTHPDRQPDRRLADKQVFGVAGIDLQVLHTPGQAPGSVCLHSSGLRVVFTGDTLFAGGPGATGRSFSDFEIIIQSIQDRLLTLPESTTIHPGHGPSATVGDVAPHLDEWIARGY